MKPTKSAHPKSCRFPAIISLFILLVSTLGLVAQVAEAPHCHGIVQKVIQPDGVVTYQLLCEGECPDGGKCDPHRSQNQHGGIREWCSCGEEEPPHCHIILYTPGRGEGGGPQQVFCSGQCPDGQSCRLSEQLIHKGDGFQVFHLVCACDGDHGNPNHSSGENDGKPADPTNPDQEVPDPTNPGNDPDTGNEEPVPTEQDSANPDPDGSIQDKADPCCSDNNKKDCKGIVQKIVQPNGIVTYQLLCDGICPDRAKCETRSSKNHHGGVREWCGCSDTEPSTCHIVIYTYGDSEPGTGQEVFCAGACPDGTACKLQEKLVRNVNGFKFFHISCECPNGDGGNANNGDDNQSNNNSDGTPNNSDDNDDTQDASNTDGNDDDCCGDDAPGAAKPCKGYVQKIVQSNGIVTYQLICGGDCPGRAKSELPSSRNHHGGVRQWCGCDKVEPSTCHIVLYTAGPGEGGGRQEVFCAGACPDGSKCAIKAVLVHRTKGGSKVFRITCDCKKAAAGAGVATALQTDGEVTGPTDETAFLTELDPDFVLEDDQETRSELKQQQAQAITILVQTEPLPTQDEKFYQLTFEGVPESLYEVLVSEDMQLWQRAGTAEEIESGHYGWADDAAMDHAPRFYTIRPLYVQRVEDLEEQN